MTAAALNRDCFICSSDDILRQASIDIDVCGLGQVAYAIGCCRGCGLTLQSPAVNPGLMRRHYQQFSNYTAFAAGDPPLSTTAGRMLRMVEIQGLPPGGVYDVGASTGQMLWHFRRRGWTVAGGDLSPKAVAQARAHYGIILDEADCEDGLRDKRGLDLATLSHVLEHLYDPPTTLRAIHAALGPNGHVLIEIPCLTRPDANPLGLFTMEHVNYFERTSLDNLLTRHGFVVVDRLVTTGDFDFPVITVLARKGSVNPDAPLRSSCDDNLAFCAAYTAREQAHWQAVEARIHACVAPGEPVYIWSAGVQTSLLLSRTDLAAYADIRAITDRDPQKYGHPVGGLDVVPPQPVLGGPHKIIIASYHYADRIHADLLAAGVAAERIVPLYDRP